MHLRFLVLRAQYHFVGEIASKLSSQMNELYFVKAKLHFKCNQYRTYGSIVLKLHIAAVQCSTTENSFDAFRFVTEKKHEICELLS